MSIHTGEADSFMAMPRRYSSADLVSDVLWPLIDFKYGAEWCQQSVDKEVLNNFVERPYNGRMLVADLVAACVMFEDGAEEEDAMFRTGELSLIETFTGEAKSTNLVLAVDAAKNLNEIIASNGEDNFTIIPDAPDDELIIKKKVTYSFDVDGEWDIDVCRIVEHEGLERDVPLGLIEFANHDTKTVRAHDLDNVELICKFFNAPNALFTALERLRENPIQKPMAA